MGFALVMVGLLMIVTGGRGTYAQFGAMVAAEFQGPNNFTYWALALGSVGALGYIDSLRLFSRLLMTLILLSLFLAHKGFFEQFNTALKQGPTPPQNPTIAGKSVGGAPSFVTGPIGQASSSADALKAWSFNPSWDSFKTFLFGTPTAEAPAP